MTSHGRILLVDDDQNFRRVVQFNLQERGHQVQVASSGEEGLAKFRQSPPDVLITDVKMPGMSGLELLDAVRRISSQPVIVITAFGSIEVAVDAMKRGATDFITKPFNRDELFAALDRCMEWGLRPPVEPQAIAPTSAESGAASATGSRRSAAARAKGRPLVGDSAPMRRIHQMIERLAQSDVTVLLQGESGTGKEVVARAIHESSPRLKSGRFVAVNCGAIPRELLESELFGHVKGSFTGAVADREGKFEQADGGTLFLDEIGDMPSELQAKILRVLQEREIERVGGDGKPRAVNVRVVAATHRHLERLVEQGAFREDLFYRLAVVTVQLPPLRDRREDIPTLVEHLLRKHVAHEDLQVTAAAMERLARHHWPGNVRELENVIQRALALRGAAERIDVGDLPEALAGDGGATPALANGNGSPQDPFSAIPPGGIVLEDVEAKLIVSAMRQAHYNQTRAADLLGISRQTLIYRIQKYNIAKSPEEDGVPTSA